MFRASHYIVYSYTTVNGIESMLNDAFVLQTCECSKIPPRRHREHHSPEIAGEISLPKSSQQNPLKMTIWSPYWILHSVSQWNLQCCNNFPPPPKQKHNIIHYPEYFKCLYIYPIYIPSKTKSTQLIPPSFAKSFHFCHAQGEDLRKQFERRQAEAATASSDEPTTLWSRKLETLVPLK